MFCATFAWTPWHLASFLAMSLASLILVATMVLLLEKMPPTWEIASRRQAAAGGTTLRRCSLSPVAIWAMSSTYTSWGASGHSSLTLEMACLRGTQVSVTVGETSHDGVPNHHWVRMLGTLCYQSPRGQVDLQGQVEVPSRVS